MAIIRITKKQLTEAAKARTAKLKKDRDFQAFEKERERAIEKAIVAKQKEAQS